MRERPEILVLCTKNAGRSVAARVLIDHHGGAHGVEIAYCPEWRGIWLDRGELDRILENASDGTRSRDGHDRHDPDGRYGDREQAQPKRKSRSSVLTDIFVGE